MLRHLATSFHKQRRFDRAEELYKQAIEALSDSTARHLRLSAYCHNLAMLYLQTGRANEAEPLLVRAYTVAEECLGPEHPRTIKRRAALAQFHNGEITGSLTG